MSRNAAFYRQLWAQSRVTAVDLKNSWMLRDRERKHGLSPVLRMGQHLFANPPLSAIEATWRASLELTAVGEHSDFCKEWPEIIVSSCFLPTEEPGDFPGAFYEEGVCRATARGPGLLGHRPCFADVKTEAQRGAVRDPTQSWARLPQTCTFARRGPGAGGLSRARHGGQAVASHLEVMGVLARQLGQPEREWGWEPGPKGRTEERNVALL